MAKAADVLEGLENLRPITVFGFDLPGGMVCIVDASGKAFKTVKQASLARPDDDLLLARKWKLKCDYMSGVAHREAKFIPRDGWDKRCDTWLRCLYSRSMDKWGKRVAVRKRFFNERSRPTWDAACKMMIYQFHNKGLRKAKSQSNPWMVWADCCSRNHNRKERNRVGKQQGFDEDRRRTSLQMRFVWR